MAEEKSEILAMGRTQLALVEGPRRQEKECGQPARKWGPQSYKRKKLNLANNLNKLGSRFFPRALSKEHSLYFSL